MKIKRSVLERIVKEELAAHLKSIMEAPEDAKKKSKKGADIGDAVGDNEVGGKSAADIKKAPTAPTGHHDKAKKPDPKAPAGNAPPKELPVADEPEVDKEMEKDVAGDEEDPADVTGGKIAEKVAGQTVQSLTMEPKSKILPGAQEITITFREKSDSLKILVTKTGQVKFFYGGSLHNEL